MKNLPENGLDIQALQDTFLFANTPAYLFKRFRADSSVQTISEGFSDAELIAAFERLAEKDPTELDARVRAYGVISALGLRDAREVKEFFERLGDSDFPWGRELRELYRASSRQQVKYVEIQKYRSPAMFDSSSDAPTTTIVVSSAPSSEMVAI
jgi:hypothetical protein